MDDHFSGVSLWLVPPQKERNALRKVIDGIAKEHHSDAFDPHITLASLSSGTSIEGWKDAIAAQLQHHGPILATFDKLFAFKADVIASITQGRAPDPKLRPDWYPHVSLFYGSPPQTVKEAIVRTLEDTRDEETCTIDQIKQFEANEVWIVQTEGQVKEWKVLDKVKAPAAA